MFDRVSQITDVCSNHPNVRRSGVPPPPSSVNSEVNSDTGAEDRYGRTRHDADEDADVIGNPDDEHVLLWGIDAARFIASSPGALGPGWVGKRPLGEGGFGRAGLWELQDDEGNVIRV